MVATAVVLAHGGRCLARQGKGELTAEQVLEKSVEATGGREAYARLTSTLARGSIEFVGQHLHGTVELYAKAPNKRLLV
ncbi:MAG: hypothetical protein ACP5U2_06595, partial [Bryobacteraceae bacterium]